jgi:hypothetical protein
VLCAAAAYLAAASPRRTGRARVWATLVQPIAPHLLTHRTERPSRSCTAFRPVVTSPVPYTLRRLPSIDRRSLRRHSCPRGLPGKGQSESKLAARVTTQTVPPFGVEGLSIINRCGERASAHPRRLPQTVFQSRCPQGCIPAPILLSTNDPSLSRRGERLAVTWQRR